MEGKERISPKELQNLIRNSSPEQLELLTKSEHSGMCWLHPLNGPELEATVQITATWLCGC